MIEATWSVGVALIAGLAGFGFIIGSAAMSVSLVSNDYLKSASANVRSKSVPWEVRHTILLDVAVAVIKRQTGLPASRSRHLGRTRAHKEGRQTTKGEDRVSAALRWTDIRLAVSSSPQEAYAGRYYPNHPRSYCRFSDRCVQ